MFVKFAILIGAPYNAIAEFLRVLGRISATIASPKMPGIADSPLARRGGLMNSGGSRHTALSIDNQPATAGQ
jgi:hypothetical protein